MFESLRAQLRQLHDRMRRGDCRKAAPTVEDLCKPARGPLPCLQFIPPLGSGAPVHTDPRHEPAVSNRRRGHRRTAQPVCPPILLGVVASSRHLTRPQGLPTPWRPSHRGRDGSDVVSVKCWAGCDRDSVRRAIEGATRWHIWGQRRDDSPAPRTQTDSQAQQPQRDRTEHARRLWAASFRIDQDPDHPARRWVARRGLY